MIVRAVQDAFFAPYLIAAALALLAAALLLPRRRAVALAAALALVIAGGYAVVARPKRPEAVVLGNPCVPRAGPDVGGLGGIVQRQALLLLDRYACQLGTTREELALALADPKRGAEFKRRYGVDPRNAGGLLSLLTG